MKEGTEGKSERIRDDTAKKEEEKKVKKESCTAKSQKKERSTAEVVKEGTHKGRRYIVVRRALEFRSITKSYYCGYEEIPPESPLYGQDYLILEDKFQDVFGGITFSGSVEEFEHALGFDCVNLMDLEEEEKRKFAERECLKLINETLRLEKKIQEGDDDDDEYF